MKRVLITGMSGLIGGLLRRHLESLSRYDLSALNRRPVEGVRCFQADIRDMEAIKPAFEGQEVVVHLARDAEEYPGNVVGTYNVYEAARLAGVKRLVFGSSGAVTSGFERVPPYDAIVEGRYEDVPEDFTKITHDMVRPDGGLYAAAKAWGEALGRHYAAEYGLSVLCVRLGRVNAENRPTDSGEVSRYLSHRDVVQILERCIEAPDDLSYDIFFATSGNRWGYRDLEHPRDVLGYVPQDSADVFTSRTTRT